jgi:hypothetical protein
VVEQTLNQKYESQFIVWFTVQTLQGGVNNKRKMKSSASKSQSLIVSTDSWISIVQQLQRGYCHSCRKSCNGDCGYWYSGYIPITGLFTFSY